MGNHGDWWLSAFAVYEDSSCIHHRDQLVKLFQWFLCFRFHQFTSEQNTVSMCAVWDATPEPVAAINNKVLMSAKELSELNSVRQLLKRRPLQAKSFCNANSVSNSLPGGEHWRHMSQIKEERGCLNVLEMNCLSLQLGLREGKKLGTIRSEGSSQRR